MAFDPATRDPGLPGLRRIRRRQSVDHRLVHVHVPRRPRRWRRAFEHEIEGCFLYSRHWNPTNKYLADALARMEDGESAQVMASGMAAITRTLLALCSAGDEIVASRTIYGGTYALLKNLLPRFGITTRFVDSGDLDAVRAAFTDADARALRESHQQSAPRGRGHPAPRRDRP